MLETYNLYNLEAPFEEYLDAGNQKAVSIKNYLSDFRHFAGWMMSTGEETSPLRGSINIKTISEYKSYLESNSIPHKTINRRLSTIRKFCSFCISQGWMKENPAKKITNISPLSSIIHHLSSDNKASESPELHLRGVQKIISKIKHQISKLHIKNQKGGQKDNKQSPPSSIIHDLSSNLGFQQYIAFLIILIFVSVMGAGIYNQFFVKNQASLAYPTTPTKAGRILSFQGRLTDTLSNPITTATNVVFQLYSVSSGGVALYNTGTCSTTPDQDGIFSSLIGSDCGSEIDASVFTENANVYLGITVGGDAEMTPRQQIANVGYAINSETLQGLPPGTGTSVIPYINVDGNLLISASAPGIRSTSTSTDFTLSSAKATVIQSAGTGDIVLQATESGTLKFRTGGITDAYTRISVDNLGNVGIGTTSPAQKLDVAGTAQMTGFKMTTSPSAGYILTSDAVGVGSWTDVSSTAGPWTLSGVNLYPDSTSYNVGIGTTAPAATSILDLTSTTKGFLAPRMTTTERDAISTPATGLMIYNTTDNQYNVFDGTIWGAVGGGGGSWSDLTVPTANLSLAHADYTTAFTFDSVTAADAFTLSSSSLTTGTILDLSSTSTAGGVSGLSKVLDITRSGTNANASHTAYGLYSAVTNTGTTSTNVGGYFSASGATNNYGLIVESGNVGIGTTAPGAKLDVEGNIWSQDLKIESQTAESGLGADYTITNAQGSINQRIRFLDNSDETTSAIAFDFSDDGFTSLDKRAMYIRGDGNVGIGTTSPGAKLDVAGGKIRIQGGNELMLQNSGDTNSAYIWNNGGATNDMLAFGRSVGSTDMVIDNSGNVGIGTTAPAQKLDVAGTAQMTGIKMTTSPSAGYVLTSDATGVGSWTDVSGSAGPWTLSGSNLYPDSTSYNVGIGTTAPLSKLGVLGNLSVGATYGAIAAPTSGAIFEGNVGIGTTSPGYKLSFGASTGAKISLYPTSDEGYGLGIQSNVLQIFSDISTTRVGIGYGTSAAFVETLSVVGGNVGIGTTGPDAKLEVNGGNADVLAHIASGADTFDARLALTEADNYGMYLEYDGAANIGYLGMADNVVPDGAWSKRIQMSRTGTEVAFMAGNVGIGTTAPANKLDVAGTAQMTGFKMTTSPSAGYILTSDATGVGNWADVSSTAGPWTLSGVNLYPDSTSYNVGIGTTSPGAGTKLAVMEGNVGIGTTAPGQALDVVGNIKSSNAFYAGAGSASNPTLTFGSNNNTGIFNPTTNQLGFAVNGAEKVRIDASGNVGIGTTGPGAKLDVNGAIKQDRGQRVNLSGRNITWQIASYLKAYTSSSNSEMFVINQYDSSHYDVSSFRTVIIDRVGNMFLGPNGGNQTSTYPVAIKTYDDGTNINVYAVAKTYDDYYTLDFVYNRLNTTINPTNVGTDTYVPSGSLVGDTATAPYYVNVGDATRLTILSTGNVGIGTTSPANKLDVAGTAQMTGFKMTTSPSAGYILTSDAVGVGSWADVSSTAGPWTLSGVNLYPDSTSYNVGIGTTAPLSKLGVLGNLSVGATYGAIAAPTSGAIFEGNVGIGTTGPEEKLHVSGGSILLSNNQSLKMEKTDGFNEPVLWLDTSNILQMRGSGGGLNLATWNGSYVNTLFANAGNVGIGTTNPSSGKFQIYQGNAVLESTTLTTTARNNGYYTWTDKAFGMELGYGQTGQSSGWGLNVFGRASDTTAIRFGKYVSGSALATNFTELMTLLNNGNVGIGTTAPSYKLDVNGSFRVQNNAMAIDTNGYSTVPTTSTPWNLFRYSNPQNIIPNGDLESWTAGTSTLPDGFSYYGGVTTITQESAAANKTQGQYSAKIVSAGAGTFQGLNFTGTRVDKNPDDSSTGTYTVSFWYKQASTNTQTARFGVYDTGAAAYVFDDNLVKDDTWHWYTKTFSLRYDSNWYVRWAVAFGTVTPGDTLYVDQITLTKGSELYNLAQASVSQTGNATRWGGFYNMGGNVGIGTTAPAQKLDVAGTAQMTGFKMTTSPSAGYILTSDATGVGSWADVSSTAGPWTLSGVNLYPDSTSYNVGIGTTAPLSKLGVLGNLSVGATYGAIAAPTSGAIFEGNVGIGTTAPGDKLHVYQNSDALAGAIIQNASTGTGARTDVILRNSANAMRIGIAGTGYTGVAGWTNKGFIGSDSTTDGLILYTNKSTADIEFQLGAVGTTDVVFKSTGNVGIGTTGPVSVLDLGSGSSGRNLSFAKYVNFGAEYSTANLVLGRMVKPVSGSGGLQYSYTGTLAPSALRLTNAGDMEFSAQASGSYTEGNTYDAVTNTKFIVKSTGNVGIGTTNPLQKLHVAGQGLFQSAATAGGIDLDGRNAWSSNIFGGAYYNGSNDVYTLTGRGALRMQLQHDSDASPQYISFSGAPQGTAGNTITWTEIMRLQTNGNVGIGTTAPANKLDVSGTAQMTGFKMTTSPSAGYILTSDATGVGSWADVSSTAGPWTLSGVNLYPDSTSYNVGIGTTAPLSKLGVLGNLSVGATYGAIAAPTSGAIFEGNVGIGTTAPGTNLEVYGANANLIKITRSSVANANIQYSNGTYNMYAGLNPAGQFGIGSTLDLTSAPFIVTSAGNVGIGTTSPADKLHVYESGAGQFSGLIIQKAGATTGDEARIDFTLTSVAPTDGAPAGARIGAIRQGANATSDLYFSTNNSAGTITERMRLTKDGNVGIGTTGPDAKLEVNGGNADVLAHIASGADTFDARLALTEADNYGMYLEYDGAANIGYLGMADNVVPDGAWSKRIQMSRTGTEVAFMAGNVGIGTTAPANKLDVAGTAQMTGIKMTTSPSAGYVLTSDATGVGSWTDVSGSAGPWTLSGSNLYPDSTAYNVGIGTTSPGAYKLNVNGNSNVTGTLNVTTSVSSPIFQGIGAAVTFGNASYGTTIAGSGLTVTPTAWTATPTISGLVTMTSGFDSNAASTVTALTIDGTAGTGDLTINSGETSFTSPATTANANIFYGNSLTSGNLLYLSSTSTALTTGSLASLDWSPGSALTATGDLLSLNIGANGNIGNLFNVKDTGSSLFSVSETAVTSNLPTSFTSSGDVSIAYDLNFTNPTASYIKSSAPFYIQAGETFNSSDLNLKTYNSGDVVLDAGGSTTGTGTVKFYDSNVKGATDTTPIGFAGASSDINTFRTNFTSETVIGSINEAYSAAVGGAGGLWLDGGTYAYPNTAYVTDVMVPSGKLGVGYSAVGASGVAAFNGNVGIGTTGPTSKFHVNGNGLTTQSFYVDAGNMSSTQTLFEHTGATTPVPFRIMKSGYSGAATNYGILELTMNDNTVNNGANLYFEAKDSGGNFTEYAGLGTQIIANTNGAERGQLNFYTMDDGTGRSNKMVINPDGNVGIGTTVPGYKLDVSGTGYVSGAFSTGSTITTPGYISITGAQDASGNLRFSAANPYINASSYTIMPGGLYVSGGTLYTTNVAQMRGGIADDGGVLEINDDLNVGAGDLYVINSSGNVGIGTTAPSQQLELTGDLKIGGDDLFMTTNTANYFLMADGTNYNPVTPAAARTGLGLVAGGAGDIWVEKAGDTMTGNLTMNGNHISNAFIGSKDYYGDRNIVADLGNSLYRNNVRYTCTGSCLSDYFDSRDDTYTDQLANASPIVTTLMFNGARHYWDAIRIVFDWGSYTKHFKIEKLVDSGSVAYNCNGTDGDEAWSTYDEPTANTSTIYTNHTDMGNWVCGMRFTFYRDVADLADGVRLRLGEIQGYQFYYNGEMGRYADTNGFTMYGALDAGSNLITNIGNTATDFTSGGGLTLAGTLGANGIVTLGDNGDNITIDSNIWNITAAGAASGFTGVSSSGNIDLSALSAGGIVKAAVTTGRLSIATAGTDYENILTFSNGLTRTVNAVKLGGTLTATTDIPLGGYNLTFSGTGNVGIGTTAPTAGYKLDVTGAIIASKLVDRDSTTYFVDPADSSLGLKTNSSIEVGNNITVSGGIISTGSTTTLILRSSGSTSVCVDTGAADCTGKIDAGTVDPPYTINGKNYATFLSAMIGVKEETTGIITTTQLPMINNQSSNIYGYTIDFSNEPEASDLWLFTKVTNLKKQIDQMTVLLTPSENTRSWYKIDKENLRLYVYSSRPTNISYRLTAPRFDSENWSNRRADDAHAGFIINDQGNITGPASSVTYNKAEISPQDFVYDGNIENFRQSNSLYTLTGDFIDEFTSVTEALIARLKAGFIEAENIIVNNTLIAKNIVVDNIQIAGKNINQLIDERINLILNSKIISPIVTTENITATGTAQLNSIATNEIRPQNQDLVINLDHSSSIIDDSSDPSSINYHPSSGDKGALAKLIIKGLEGKTVTTIDSAGNASFSGQIIADSLTINADASVAGTFTAQSSIINHLSSNDASISGKLIAGEIESSTINDIQALLADIRNQPIPDPTNYQNIDPNVGVGSSNPGGETPPLQDLIVTGQSNLYNVSVSNSLLVGTTLFDQNSIISLASELKLSALAKINLFDGAVIIAKDGKITTRGEIIAKGGIRTDEIKPLTDDGQVTINNLAIDNLTINNISTNSAIIAAADNFAQNGIFAPAIETATASAGVAILPENSSEVIIYNNYVKDDSLIYLTPTSLSSPVSLTIGQKRSCQSSIINDPSSNCKSYFTVVTNTKSTLPVKFNWLIVN